MKKDQQYEIIPVQPYIVIHTDNYQSMIQNSYGISHFYEFTVGEETRAQIQAVPDGSVDLLFSIGTQKVRAYIGGTVLQAKDWPLLEGEKYFGIRFQPGKCILPKNLSIQEIIDKDLEISGNGFGDHLSEKMMEGNGIRERAQLFLKQYLKKNWESIDENTGCSLEDYVQNRIYQCKGNLSIQKLAEETGYSSCYVRRVFKQLHGISPKVFEKFVRFQNLLNKMDPNSRELRIEEIALDCGYYDQSHMIKDFKCFAGMTPEVYLQMMADQNAKNQ